MRSYRLTGPAQQDLRDIGRHVSRDSASAALRVVANLESRCQRLAEMPGMGRSRDELAAELRSFTVSPYLIFYRETEYGIEVMRVLHGARDIDAIFGNDPA